MIVTLCLRNPQTCYVTKNSIDVGVVVYWRESWMQQFTPADLIYFFFMTMALGQLSNRKAKQNHHPVKVIIRNNVITTSTTTTTMMSKTTTTTTTTTNIFYFFVNWTICLGVRLHPSDTSVSSNISVRVTVNKSLHVIQWQPFTLIQVLYEYDLHSYVLSPNKW